MKTYICRGCGKSIQSAQLSGYDVAKDIGWSLMLTFGSDVQFIWLCPTCASKVATLATKIVKILKTENLHLCTVARCGSIDGESV